MGPFIRSRRRFTALWALVLFAFVQVAFASAGCIGTPTSMAVGLNDPERCPTEKLLCQVHCQAEAQTLDHAGISVPAVANLPLPAFALPEFVASMLPASRLDPPPPGGPPPRLLFERFLN